MKKEIPIIILILLVVGGAYAYSKGLINLGTFKFAAASCQDTFCNQYRFICCAEDTLNPETKNAVYGGFSAFGLSYGVQCPTSASKCNLATSVSGIALYTTCSSNGAGYQCSGSQGQASYGQDVSAGIWFVGPSPFSIKAYQTKLFDCGASACAAGATGIEVPNSLGCVAVTNKNIYDQNGNLVQAPIGGVDYQYTVPKGRCYQYTTGNLRTVCGNTCETCNQNSDCVAGHTYTYNYQGSTYGAEFSGATQLTLYGCRKDAQVCLEKNILANGQEQCVGGYATPSRCEGIYTIPVGCAPGSNTCGSNAFCDPTTFTCKNTIQCTQDSDCGNAGTVCDYSTKTYKRNGCFNNQCGSQIIKTVQCCSDVNCANGYYCDSDFTCKQGVPSKTTCPLECCVGDSQYFDKPCPIDKTCSDNRCVNPSVCAKEGEQTTPLKKCCDGLAPIGGILGIGATCQKPTPQLPWDLIFGAIVAFVAFFTTGGLKKLKDKEYDGLGISIVLAVVAFLVTWYVIQNWVAIAVSLGILAVLGGIGLYFFGGALLVIFFVIGQIIKNMTGD